MQTAFPVGKLDSLKGVTRDIEYMESLMKEIRAHKVGGAERSGLEI